MPHLLGGIGLVLRDRYLLLIALFVVLLNWINSTGEFILGAYVKAHAHAQIAATGGGEEALSEYIAAFMGNFNFWVTLIGLGIQLLLVARIYRLVGMRGALLVHPVIVAVGYGLLAFAPMLGGFIPIFSLIRRIKVADNGVDYSLMNTTRQALFLPVDRDSKYEGKMAIDTFFWRFRRPAHGSERVRGTQHSGLGLTPVRPAQSGTRACLDIAGAGHGPKLQQQGPRDRDQHGSRGRRPDTRSALFPRTAVQARSATYRVPGCRCRRCIDASRHV